MKFKVGDKVRAIHDCGDHLSGRFQIGNIYKIDIIDFNDMKCPYKLDSGAWAQEWELDLVEEMHIPKISISGKILPDASPKILVGNKELNIKGENKNMKLLEIYKKRELEEINEKYDTMKKDILDKDEFKILTKNYETQVKDLYLNEFGFETKFTTCIDDVFRTKETKDNLTKIKEEKEFLIKNLEEKIEEIEAQLELTNDYETIKKILKKYDVLDKSGKVSL